MESMGADLVHEQMPRRLSFAPAVKTGRKSWSADQRMKRHK
jgi:hypothetical protein